MRLLFHAFKELVGWSVPENFVGVRYEHTYHRCCVIAVFPAHSLVVKSAYYRQTVNHESLCQFSCKAFLGAYGRNGEIEWCLTSVLYLAEYVECHLTWLYLIASRADILLETAVACECAETDVCCTPCDGINLLKDRVHSIVIVDINIFLLVAFGERREKVNIDNDCNEHTTDSCCYGIRKFLCF